MQAHAPTPTWSSISGQVQYYCLYSSQTHSDNKLLETQGCAQQLNSNRSLIHAVPCHAYRIPAMRVHADHSAAWFCTMIISGDVHVSSVLLADLLTSSPVYEDVKTFFHIVSICMAILCCLVCCYIPHVYMTRYYTIFMMRCMPK